MHKVLIIEDEICIRDGLTNTINWSELGCTVCGCADSGLTGLEKYLETKPDIIVTDIVMPGVDGITFLNYINSRSQDVKVILITGFRNFEYAKEAANLGVYAFFLKPIDFNELIKCIKTLVMELSHKGKGSLRKEMTVNDEKENLIQKRGEFFLSLLRGNICTQEYILKLLNECNISIKKYCVATAGLDSICDSDENLPGQQQILIHDLHIIIREAIKERNNYIPINVENRLICIIIGVDDIKDPGREDITKHIKWIQTRIKSTFQYNLSFGISRISCEIVSIYNYYKESLSALEQRFFSGENSINFFENWSSKRKLNEVESFFDNSKIVNIIKNYNGRELMKEANNVFVDIVAQVHKDKNLLKSIIMGILFNTTKKVCSGDIKYLGKLLKKYNYFKSIIDSEYIFQINDIFSSLMIDLNDYTQKKKVNSKEEIMTVIMEYLEDNYSKDIKLNDIAEYFYFSQSYISNLIKQGSGKSFIDILNDIRIKNAKNLFSTTTLKSYEVAERVGINDPHYFSQVFKKVTGSTPTDYIESLK